ncbi:MAG: MASE3 domain-containing protein, partial [Atribacterota bacterium]
MVLRVKKTFLAGFWSPALLLLYSLSRRNYLLFHSIVEFLAIFTGFAMFLFAVAASSVSRNTVVQKLGWLYLGVGSIDTLHTLSYKGMGVFPGYTANLPTQFWILGRLVEFGGLAVIVLWSRRVSITTLVLAVFSAAIAGSSAIFWGYFPDCFLEGRGLTLFKVLSEYAMIALLFTLLIQVQRDRDEHMLPFRKPISWALVLSALAEFSFTLYTDVYGFFNMLGHLFRFISYFVLLEGIVVESIRKPFDALLFEVQQEKNQLEEIAKRDA